MWIQDKNELGKKVHQFQNIQRNDKKEKTSNKKEITQHISRKKKKKMRFSVHGNILLSPARSQGSSPREL